MIHSNTTIRNKNHTTVIIIIVQNVLEGSKKEINALQDYGQHAIYHKV